MSLLDEIEDELRHAATEAQRKSARTFHLARLRSPDHPEADAFIQRVAARHAAEARSAYDKLATFQQLRRLRRTCENDPELARQRACSGPCNCARTE